MNYLPYITFKRFCNLFQIGLSYLLSKGLKKSFYFGKPYAVSVEVSSICNLNCHQCIVGRHELKRNNKLISIDDFKIILDKLPPEIFYINLYFQGEPLLNPDIFKMIQWAKKKHLYVLISTNATLLDEKCCLQLVESGLDKIIVSLDGSSQRIYEKYRSGGNLQDVLSGIEILQRTKRKSNKRLPKLEIQAVVFKTNEHDLSNIRQIAINHHAESVVFKTAQIYDIERYEDLLPDNPAYARYQKDEQGNYRLKNQDHATCFRFWTSNVITSDGDFLPCCYDKNGAYRFGNIFENSYDELLNNDTAKSFRTQICKDRKAIDLCNSCY